MPVDSLLAESGTTGWRKYLTNLNRAWRCGFDTALGVFKWMNASGTVITAIDNTHDQTVAGNKTFSGTSTFSGAVNISGALTTTATGALQTAVVPITNAEMLALRATPKQLVAAPGAGFALIYEGGHITIDYTAAYTESADNIAVRYTNGSGVQVSTTETTGFLDATADSIMTMAPIAPTTAPVAVNAALVLHNTGDGEWGGGNAANVITATVHYRIVAVP